MFDITSFFNHRNLVTTEVFGEGKHTYEVLISLNGVLVVKVWINANNMEQFKGYLSKRFNIDVLSHDKLSSDKHLYCYRLNVVNSVTKCKAFEDIVVRKVF